ncbi:MAG: arginase [bacterium]
MQVKIVGVPIDLGANRRGVDMGPSAIRYALLREKIAEIGHQVEDLGNIEVPERDSLPQHIVRADNLKHLPEILEVNRHLAEVVAKIMAAGDFPLVLGGDHSISIGTIAGLASQVESLGVIWFDAHGDFNTPATTSSGNIHGMPLAISVGRGAVELVNCGTNKVKVKEKNVVIIGARDLDPEEKQLLQSSEVTVFTMQDIDERGMRQVVKEGIEIAGSGVEGIHVSFDLDVIDPMQAPGVGTPVRGGITYREAHLAMELVAQSDKLLALDMVEVNPILDYRNQTAELAVELITSALGKRIL